MTTTVDYSEMLSIARYQLNRTSPFLAHLINTVPCDFTCLSTPGKRGTACCTDEGPYGHIYFDMDFAATLTQRQFNFVLLHEVLHLALGWFTRLHGRSHRKFNRAHDYLINWVISHWEGLPVEKVPGMLYDDAYADKAAEEIYDILPDEQEFILKITINGDGTISLSAENGFGEPMDCVPSGTSPEEQLKQQETLRRLLHEAIMQEELRNGKGAGHGFGPGKFSEWVKSIIRPDIPWKEQYQHMLNGHIRGTASSWIRPSKKSQGMGVLLPGHKGRNIPEFWMVGDSSGSITSEEFRSFLGASAEILEDSDTPCRFIQVDTGITSDEMIEDFDDLKLHRTGFGGTSFLCIPKYIEEQGTIPDLVILFTDGDATWPDPSEWPCEVLVVTTKTMVPGYKCVKLKMPKAT